MCIRLSQGCRRISLCSACLWGGLLIRRRAGEKRTIPADPAFPQSERTRLKLKHQFFNFSSNLFSRIPPCLIAL